MNRHCYHDVLLGRSSFVKHNENASIGQEYIIQRLDWVILLPAAAVALLLDLKTLVVLSWFRLPAAMAWVLPAASSGGRALHRVGARGDTMPGDDLLTARMKGMSIGPGGDSGGSGNGNGGASVGRGAKRGRRDLALETIRTRPVHVATKKGSSGTQVNLRADYYKLETHTDWCLYQYRVDFAPEEDRTFMRRALLSAHKEILGGHIFDGTMLFTSHILQTDSQTQRITELCTVNNTLIHKLYIQDEELNTAQSEIKLLQTLVQENKNHMVKAQEQSRRSVVGVESKLEQIAAVSQNQVATLKEQLAEEVKLCSELQQQINELNNIVREKDSEHQSESAEIIHLKNELQQQREQCKELEQKVIFLRDKAHTAVRNQELATKTLVAELEKKLRREKEECRELKSKLVSLELSESILSQESAVSARDTEREAHVAMLEKELKQASSEKMKLIHRLQEAKHKEEEDNRKLETLEGLLEHLEQGLARLEEENQKLKRESKQGVDVPDSGTLVKELEQQKIMLVAQVEKLETQVEKAREVSFQDRQAAKTAQEQLWKKEKELPDAKIDLRIAQREADIVLQEEKQKWMEKFQTEKNNHASQLQAERDKLDQLHDQISALENELQETRRKEEAAKRQVDACFIDYGTTAKLPKQDLKSLQEARKPVTQSPSPPVVSPSASASQQPRDGSEGEGTECPSSPKKLKFGPDSSLIETIKAELKKLHPHTGEEPTVTVADDTLEEKDKTGDQKLTLFFDRRLISSSSINCDYHSLIIDLQSLREDIQYHNFLNGIENVLITDLYGDFKGSVVTKDKIYTEIEIVEFWCGLAYGLDQNCKPENENDNYLKVKIIPAIYGCFNEMAEPSALYLPPNYFSNDRQMLMLLGAVNIGLIEEISGSFKNPCKPTRKMSPGESEDYFLRKLK